MKKLYFLFFALLGVLLSSCGNDDDDVSAINKVKCTESSCIRANDKIAITASVENYTPQSLECWLYVGRSSDFLTDCNYIWSSFKMDYDWSKKKLSTEIPSDYFSETTDTFYGHIIVTDFVKHESIELGKPLIVFNSTQAN